MFTVDPISMPANFFLKGVSLILVLINMKSFSEGEEAIVKDLVGPSASSFVTNAFPIIHGCTCDHIRRKSVIMTRKRVPLPGRYLLLRCVHSCV